MGIGKRGTAAAVVIAGSALALSACAGGSGTESSGASSSAGKVKIAYLSASAANTWLAASQKAMQEDAAKQNVEIVPFDAKFQTGVAAKQIRDVITSGQYKGIIVATVDGAALAPAVTEAIDAGLKVVVLNQIIGTKLDTADPQVAGISASVLAPPSASGRRLGTLTNQACKGVNPCRVVYMFGQKGIPYDTAARAGFDATVESNVKIVAEGEGGFLGADKPRKATQDIIQSHPSFDVFVGAGDQQVKGAILALDDAGLSSVKVIGAGGSEPAIAGVKDGTWWGDVAGAPVTEGHTAFEAMMHALAGKNDGGIDVTSKLIDDGLITKANVDKFTAQWPG